MKRRSNPGSSLGKEYAKGSDALSFYQKSKTIRDTITFIRRRGGRATGNTRIAKHKGCGETYADIIATITGQPVELLVGVRRLSHKQREYRRAVQNAGMVHLVIADADEFKEWYRGTETFKPSRP